MRVPFLNVGASVQSLRTEVDAAITRVLDAGWFVLGPELEAFEQEFATYVGAASCVGVANGLDALTLSLRAAGIGEGDAVVVPTHTFIATWLAVTAVGARPIPVDVDPRTYVMDHMALQAVAESISVRAVIPVHLYGQPVDIPRLVDTAASLAITVIEDAAQAHGAALNGAPVGSHGCTAAWSFYPGKNLGALGDGGAVTTFSPSMDAELRRLRNYGSVEKYKHEVVGVNSRLDEIQAAVLRVKLRHLAEWNARRADIARTYTSALDGLVRTPVVRDGATSAWHLFVIRTEDQEERDRLQTSLGQAGVETLIHYPTPVSEQVAYASSSIPFGNADSISRTVLSLPIGPHMSDRDVEHVIGAVKAFYRSTRSI